MRRGSHSAAASQSEPDTGVTQHRTPRNPAFCNISAILWSPSTYMLILEIEI